MELQSAAQPPSRRPSFTRSASSSYIKIHKINAAADDDLISSRARRSRRSCLLASALAFLILVLGLSTFLFIHLRSISSSSHHHTPPSPSPPSSSSSAISAACNSTSFPSSCFSLLSSSPDSSPLHLASLSLTFAIAAVRRAASLLSSASVSTSSSHSLASSAISDCVELTDLSDELLNTSLALLHSVSLRSVVADLKEMKVQISGVLAYQLSCEEGLEGAASNGSSAEVSTLVEAQANVSETVRIALGIVDFIAGLGNDLSSWKSIIGGKVHLRRRSLLAEEVGMEEEGFPEWMAADQRRRLQEAANGTAAAVVAKDGSGDFSTIQEALDNWSAAGMAGGYTIHVKAGVYEEYIEITKKMIGLTLIGDGAGATIISGSKNFLQGITTSLTATVAIKGSHFIARGITFRNTAGPASHQAVALKAMADYGVFDACGFEGYQDTLYALALRQFYTGCTIYGTIDFIFGDAAAVFQDTQIVVRQPLPKQFNTVTAQGRSDKDEVTGFSFQKCTIAGDSGLQASILNYFGRPWRPYSRTAFIQSSIGGLISPLGWVAWDAAADPAPANVDYGEYQNTGDGADTSRRVAWAGVHSALTQQQAEAFTVDSLISGSTWLPSAQVSYQESL